MEDKEIKTCLLVSFCIQLKIYIYFSPRHNFPLFQPSACLSSCYGGSTSYSHIITIYLGGISEKTSTLSSSFSTKLTCAPNDSSTGLLNIFALSLSKIDFFSIRAHSHMNTVLEFDELGHR